jgi:hypothetical protein
MKRRTQLKRTPLRRISKAREADYRLYLKERDEFLSQNQFCEFPTSIEHTDMCTITTAGCANHSTTVHHSKGQGKLLRDQRYWWPLCMEHHRWVEDHKKQARKMGLITYK